MDGTLFESKTFYNQSVGKNELMSTGDAGAGGLNSKKFTPVQSVKGMNSFVSVCNPPGSIMAEIK